jgi:RNA polymerase sigma factor (sigma-70 family)
MGLHGRSPLLRLQSDERLISLIRRGNDGAFELLVSRYQSRLLAFCRHLLGSREDAEDVLQEVLAAAFNAILADERQINVRPWLYRIARNRCLNHLRRIQAVGVDSMDVHLSDHGASTADKVHDLEEFRMLVGDIQELPETQRTALVLREMDALSYEQIAEAMETTVPSVKSLLVRARVSLAEAAEARMLSCQDVRIELAEVSEGLRRRPTSLVRRHLRSCNRCSTFHVQLKETNKALTALLPLGPLVLLRKLIVTHIGHSAGAGSGASGAGAAGQAAAIGTTAAGTSAFVGSSSGMLSVGVGAIASKAAAGLAAAALVTAGAVEVSHTSRVRHTRSVLSATQSTHATYLPTPVAAAVLVAPQVHPLVVTRKPKPAKKRAKHAPATTTPATTTTTTTPAATTTTPAPTTKTTDAHQSDATTTTGRTETQTDPTVVTQPTSTTDPSTPTTTTTTSTDPTTSTSTDPSSTQTTPPTDPTSTTPTTTNPPDQPADPSGGAGVGVTGPACPDPMTGTGC